MAEISKRLYIATQLANTIDPPSEGISKDITERSYYNWAKHLLKMADNIIKVENELSYVPVKESHFK